MKITVITTTDKEIEISLPYYSRYKETQMFYKVVSETQRICVNADDTHTEISLTSYIAGSFSEAMMEVTEKEFNEAHRRAYNLLKL